MLYETAGVRMFELLNERVFKRFGLFWVISVGN